MVGASSGLGNLFDPTVGPASQRDSTDSWRGAGDFSEFGSFFTKFL